MTVTRDGRELTQDEVLAMARDCEEKALHYGKHGMHKLKNRLQRTAREWREIALQMGEEG